MKHPLMTSTLTEDKDQTEGFFFKVYLKTKKEIYFICEATSVAAFVILQVTQKISSKIIPLQIKYPLFVNQSKCGS